MKIVTFTPARDWKGRFIPSRKKVLKTLFVLASLISFYANYALAKQIYNFRCKVDSQIVGYFTTDISCNEIAETKFELRELDRELRLKEAKAENNEIY